MLSPKNEIGTFDDLKRTIQQLGGVGGTNDQSIADSSQNEGDEENRSEKEKGDSAAGKVEDTKIKEKLEQYERLKAEFETLANDLIAERRARSCF